MKRLWAPWRIGYLKGAKPPGCIFCDKPRGGDDESNLILHRGPRTFVIMNLYPYTNGHLMVVPYEHSPDLSRIDGETAAEIFSMLDACRDALVTTMNPEGFNIGINMGRVAGAGIHEHVHVHIVPRWLGDTNFMPVIGDAKVISEGIRETFRKLAPRFASLPRRKEPL
ncbi:HIT domain-containing protein [bacterium]|nr:HIT domain-containing protein [bacterium]